MIRAAALCLLLIVVAIVAVPMDQASSPTTISYHADLAAMTRTAPYQVVSAGRAAGVLVAGEFGRGRGRRQRRGHGDLAARLHHPSGTFAALEETNASGRPLHPPDDQQRHAAGTGSGGRPDVGCFGKFVNGVSARWR